MFFRKKKYIDDKDFKALEFFLYDDCIRVIREFSETDENKDVYAFVIDGDPDHGSIVVCMSTLDSFKGRVEQAYRDYPEERLYGISGLKYSVGDFRIRYTFDELSKPLNTVLNKYYDAMVNKLDLDKVDELNYNREMFITALINVCRKLQNDFSLLNRTDDFIAFVTSHDISLETFIQLMKYTVDEDTFDRVFPEVGAYERFKKDIYCKDIKEQIEFWLKAFTDFELKIDSQETRKITSYQKTKYDVKNELVRLGEITVNDIIPLVEKYGVMKQINYTWTIPVKERLAFMKTVPEKERDKYKAFTNECDFTSHLLLLLMDIGQADDESVRRLYKVLELLFEDSKGKEMVGPNLSLVARTLNKIRPREYPVPEIGSSDNRLINFNAFGLK